MTDMQKTELDDYVSQAREYSHFSKTGGNDRSVIRDYIDAYGDYITWETIERFIKVRRFSSMTRDGGRRVLYRWKAWKEGVGMDVITDLYMDPYRHLRACEVVGCADRDQYGFCTKKFRFRTSCPTLKLLDELARDPERKKEKKPEPDKADWLFGKVCSYKDAACAVFKGNL